MNLSPASTALLECLPRPPAFLDPLYNMERCFYYAVPSFFKADHSSNCWMVKRILASDTDVLKRKLERFPGSFRDRYFQVLDNPAVYMNSTNIGDPMFHRKCVLYLTPLGLALYFKSPDVISLLLNFRSPNGESIASVNEPQFASHVFDKTEGDFHAFVPYIVMLKRELFGMAVLMQQNGWQPNQPLALPARRRYQRQVVYYRDWLDAGLCHMATRPTFPLAALVLAVTTTSLYSYSRLPMEAVKPTPVTVANEQEPSDQEKPMSKQQAAAMDPTLYRYYGTIPADDKPHSVPLIGAKNLLELCLNYDRHNQELECMHNIRKLFSEAKANGINKEILLMQADECIAEDKGQDRNNYNRNSTSSSSSAGSRSDSYSESTYNEADLGNSNNHARKKKEVKVKKSPEDKEHCSEPLRVLVFALTRDKTGARLHQCLDAVGVYVKRGYFCSSQALELDHPRSRDARNVVVCLMNLMAREYRTVDALMERIQRGDRCRRSLESSKQMRTSIIAKMSGLMTSVMLSSQTVLSFLHSKAVLPFSKSTVDFQVEGRALSAMGTIRYGVVRDINGYKDAWKYLPVDMLARLAKDPSIVLHFKVGRQPTREALLDSYRRKQEKMLLKGN